MRLERVLASPPVSHHAATFAPTGTQHDPLPLEAPVRLVLVVLGIAALCLILCGDAEAKNPIRADFFATYPGTESTQLGALASNSKHCGMCHFDFNGGGPRNWYGARVEELRAAGSTSVEAFLAIEAEDSDGDSFDNLTEITDLVNYPNTPTFPGLSSDDLGSVVNIPLSEISPYLTPTSTVDNDPPVVTVTSPSGGEFFDANTTVAVSWTISDASDISSVQLFHSDDAGLSWKTASFTIADTGTHDWFVPHRPGSDNLIRIVAVDAAGNEGQGESASTFSISAITTGRVPTTLADVDMPGTQPFDGPVLADPDDNCALCHGNYDTANEPWAVWRGNMMSQAARDPIFLACLAVAEQDAPSVGDICLRCHAPRGWLAGRSIDTSGESLTAEDRKGISCDFCHKLVDWNYVEGVSPAEDADILAALPDPPTDYNSGQYVVAPTAAKRGPYDDALDTGHPVLQSEFHRSSALCGTCHDVSNAVFSRVGPGDYAPNTFDEPHPTMDQSEMGPVERTFSEWEASDFANGGVDLPQYGGVVSTCQDCHMRDVVAAGSNDPNSPIRTDLPLHDMTGGNTVAQDMIADLYPAEVDLTQLEAAKTRARETLGKAIQLELTPDDGGVNVRVVNDTGHKLPTGYPEGRRMWITVEARDETDQIVYTSGAYDFATGVLDHDEDVKIYQVKPGFSPALASALGLPEGPSFHFVLNDSVIVDNRIPPRGFTNAAFEALQMPPVAATYADGQYWDDTYYALPNTAATVDVKVYYQAISKEYVEFLREENTTTDDGETLYQLWDANGRGAPELMAEASATVEILTAVDDGRSSIAYALGMPAPNPFGGRTSFQFALAAPGKVQLEVYDVRGRRVRVLENEIRPAGRYTAHWDGKDDHGSSSAAGVYFVRLRSGSFEATQRMVLMK